MYGKKSSTAPKIADRTPIKLNITTSFAPALPLHGKLNAKTDKINPKKSNASPFVYFFTPSSIFL
jgi:hypothetical protein